MLKTYTKKSSKTYTLWGTIGNQISSRINITKTNTVILSVRRVGNSLKPNLIQENITKTNTNTVRFRARRVGKSLKKYLNQKTKSHLEGHNKNEHSENTVRLPAWRVGNSLKPNFIQKNITKTNTNTVILPARRVGNSLKPNLLQKNITKTNTVRLPVRRVGNSLKQHPNQKTIAWILITIWELLAWVIIVLVVGVWDMIWVLSEKLCHCGRPLKVLVSKKKTRVRNAKGDLVSNRHCLFLEI